MFITCIFDTLVTLTFEWSDIKWVAYEIVDTNKTPKLWNLLLKPEIYIKISADIENGYLCLKHQIVRLNISAQILDNNKSYLTIFTITK